MLSGGYSQPVPIRTLLHIIHVYMYLWWVLIHSIIVCWWRWRWSVWWFTQCLIFIIQWYVIIGWLISKSCIIMNNEWQIHVHTHVLGWERASNVRTLFHLLLIQIYSLRKFTATPILMFQMHLYTLNVWLQYGCFPVKLRLCCWLLLSHISFQQY